MTSRINLIKNYGQMAINKFKQTGHFINHYSDPINDGINTTNDIISNVQLGRDLIDSNKNTPQIAKGFETNYSKMVDDVLENHLDKLELTKSLTEEERRELLTNLSGDRESFTTFSLGGKPAITFYGGNYFLKPNKNQDILRKKIETNIHGKTVYFDNTVVINKELTNQTIEQNKEIYTTRMGLDKNASTEEIYAALLGENSPLLGNEKHDLIGITLGYSPINSIIFQLDQSIPFNLELREDTNTYKKMLLNQLYKEDSPYKDFDNQFIAKIAQNIRNIGNNNNAFNTDWAPFGFSCRNIVPDEEHNQRLIKSIIACFQNAKSL